MLITKFKQLTDAIEILSDYEKVALDTEFVRKTTYFPYPCLIQLLGGDNTVIIDIIALLEDANWVQVRECIKNYFSSSGSLFILHAGLQDLELLYNQFSIPKNIFDTQIASRFLGFNQPPSYKSLVKYYLGVDLQKEMQFSDWNLRPLSAEQIKYAKNDVLYLHDLYEILNSKLEEKSRSSWLKEEISYMVNAATTIKGDNFSDLQKLIPQITSLEQAYFCYALLRAREIVAREHDVKKAKVFPEKTLSKQATVNIDNFITIISPPYKESFVSKLVGVLKDSDSWKGEVEKRWSNGYSIDLKQKDLFARIKKELLKISENIGISPEFIASNKDITQFLEKRPSLLLNGWRHEVLGKSLMKFL